MSGKTDEVQQTELPMTIFDKIWNAHVVREFPSGSQLIYVDRQLLHEATSAQAFRGLELAGRKIWRQQTAVAVPDHSVPTKERSLQIRDTFARVQVEALSKNCISHDVKLFDLHDQRQGIVHIVGPEQGLSLPGTILVCGDSHTSTHGALGAVAFGIGTSEVEHVLATQTLVSVKPKNMLVTFTGALGRGVTAKDMALHFIRTVGAAGGTGFAVEYAGDAVSALSIEGRMTLCNMTIEAGARCGIIAFDASTRRYLEGRPFAPRGELWAKAVKYWETLASDPGARYEKHIEIGADTIEPMVTWGTSPDMATPISGRIPDPADMPGSAARIAARALAYMDLVPGMAIRDIRPNVIFIGSCTNSRIEDLRAAAGVLKDRRIAASIKRALVVPGSGLVKRQAEEEGLHTIFKSAGFEWRDAGCSMCVGMNDDSLEPGDRCASTSNRNFEDRQGPGGRTHLVSPSMAAAAAVAGHFVDVRELAQPVHSI